MVDDKKFFLNPSNKGSFMSDFPISPCRAQIFVQVLTKTISCEIDLNSKVRELQKQICSQFNLSEGDMRLVSAGKELQRRKEATLFEYGIGKGSVIDVRFSLAGGRPGIRWVPVVLLRPEGDKTINISVRHDETVASVLDKVNAVLNNGFNGFNGPLISQREGLLLEHETTMEMLSDLKKVLVDPSAGTAEFKFKET